MTGVWNDGQDAKCTTIEERIKDSVVNHPQLATSKDPSLENSSASLIDAAGPYSTRQSGVEGARILEVGCGGGFLSEGLARRGAIVTGLDPSVETIKIAESHRRSSIESLSPSDSTRRSLDRLHYIHGEVEEIKNNPWIRSASDESKEDRKTLPDHQFDIVVASEVIEHVNNPETFFRHCADCVKPGGLLIITTPNRTPLSYLLVIAFAEYVLRLIPVGTHYYSKFIKPAEIKKMGEQNGFSHLETRGTFYIPIFNKWITEPTTWVTYMTALRKLETPER
ncbi:ubiquinone biosynthesis O-methyltransferase-like [Condylostylus longicornis]|uniref:ubiquinone biosynthesis O-methyltransferase-like n=1 Tax=Condylostylus longicornis TaxID=2530218 RepID=UPI00244DB034|nr:ubiquinone biosynthesis O-methyltransferase-like [Condylostylus longicornis]